jgi:RND family efflux transporter MFP subunit
MRRWLILAAIGLAIALRGGLIHFMTQNAHAQTTPSAPTTVAVTRGDVQQLVTAAGKLVNTRKVTLSTGADGTLSAVNVRPGDVVQAGDVLAALDTTDSERQVAQAEQAYLIQQTIYSATLQPDASTVASARAAVSSAHAAYQAAQQKYATSQDQITVSCFNLQDAADAVGRTRDAYEAIANDLRGWIQAEKQGRKAAWESAQNAYAAALARCNLARDSVNDSSVRAAQAQLLEAQKTLSNLISPTTTSLISARADLESARLSLEAARRQLSHTTIVAPFAGIVAEVDHQVGDMISADTAIIILIDPTALEVEADVAEQDLPLVQTGQAAQLLFDAQPDIIATGHVERIVPARMSGAQALYPVYLTFDQLPDGLAADMSVDISITIAGKSNVLRLPRSVVRAKADNTAQVSVWVNDHVEPRSITIGLRGDVYVEIVTGLAEGELVVSQ